MTGILFPQDLIKIEYACMRYPIGSFQAGEIVKLSGYLYQNGIDVEKLLRDEIERRKIMEV